jgi:uncharacterized phage-associated protein
MISVLDVAWYFVLKGNGEHSVTQLKLQKLCYYAQGLHIAKFGEPLFSETIEAWDYGPVVVELRQIHSHRGAETISPYEPAFGKSIVYESITELLDKVWGRLGNHSAGELVDMTHAEAPWIEAYGQGQNTKISEELMGSYFTNQAINKMEEDSVTDSCCFISINFKDGTKHKVHLDEAPEFVREHSNEIETQRRERKGSSRLVKV